MTNGSDIVIVPIQKAMTANWAEFQEFPADERAPKKRDKRLRR